MADFQVALEKILEHEGIYSNNPKDIGGETFYGISRKNFPKWSGWFCIDRTPKDKESMLSLSKDEIMAGLVSDFYYINFWEKIDGDSILNDEIATKVFDIAVNMGVSIAGMFLQQGLNLLMSKGKPLVIDGNIGDKTILVLTKLNKSDYLVLTILLKLYQGSYYLKIIENKNTQKIFLRGWLKRIGI